MTVGGTASIFRLDANGETEDTDEANESIEFGAGALNPDAFSHLSNISIEYVEDTSVHPNPNRHLSQVQANKLGTMIVTFTGFIDRPTASAFLTKMDDWMTNDKTNSSLPYGRFGIRDDNMSFINLVPSSTQGYILKSFKAVDVEEYENRAEFTIVLYRNGAV